VQGSLLNEGQSFICRCCKGDRPVRDGLNTDLHLDIGNGLSLEKVDRFCYIGDMFDADGGCDSAVTARVRSAWKKFSEYLPILTGKGYSLKLKRQEGTRYLCEELSGVYGNETWPMKVEHELKLNRIAMTMIRWMCGVKLNLSLHFNIFQVVLGKPVFIEAKDDGGGGDDNWTTGAISRAKLQPNHHHQQTNIQFLRSTPLA